MCQLRCLCTCRYDYVLAREYNWNVKNKASRGYEENYFFVMKDDGVYYNELETRWESQSGKSVQKFVCFGNMTFSFILFWAFGIA